jgi:hypothetical protein
MAALKTDCGAEAVSKSKWEPKRDRGIRRFRIHGAYLIILLPNLCPRQNVLQYAEKSMGQVVHW